MENAEGTEREYLIPNEDTNIRMKVEATPTSLLGICEINFLSSRLLPTNVMFVGNLARCVGSVHFFQSEIFVS